MKKVVFIGVGMMAQAMIDFYQQSPESKKKKYNFFLADCNDENLKKYIANKQKICEKEGIDQRFTILEMEKKVLNTAQDGKNLREIKKDLYKDFFEIKKDDETALVVLAVKPSEVKKAIGDYQYFFVRCALSGIPIITVAAGICLNSVRDYIFSDSESLKFLFDENVGAEKERYLENHLAKKPAILDDTELFYYIKGIMVVEYDERQKKFTEQQVGQSSMDVSKKNRIGFYISEDEHDSKASDFEKYVWLKEERFENIYKLYQNACFPMIGRLMPNLAVKYGSGVLAYCWRDFEPEKRWLTETKLSALFEERKQSFMKNKETQSQKAFAAFHSFFKPMGYLFKIEQNKMCMLTALIGSSPAFVALFADAFCISAKRLGFSSNDARKMISFVFRGVADLLEKEDMSPNDLMDRISSPSGTTLEGLVALEKAGFRYAVISAVESAEKKAKKMETTEEKK